MPRQAESQPVATAPPNPPFVWTRKHLLSLEELTRAEILHLLDAAERFRPISTCSDRKSQELRGCVVATLFFEDSTRTRLSFTLAAQRLSADVLDLSAKASSTAKGESLIDTAHTVEAMGVDVIIVRHAASGAAYRLAQAVECRVVNAGDGQHEHPTQGLLDLFTMREKKGRLEGLKVAIVGDVAHSRVARSNLHGLSKLGAHITFVGPPTLLPRAFETLGARLTHDLDAVLPEMDVVMMLRIQNERITSSVFPSVREYTRLFGLNRERLSRCKPDVLLMHPGPMNRGVEMTPEAADDPRSVVRRQVTNGLAVRMAALALCAQTAEDTKSV